MVSEVMKKAQRTMNDQYRRQQNQNYNRQDGDIHIDYAPPAEKKKYKFKKEGGEFVDYEEIK